MMHVRVRRFPAPARRTAPGLLGDVDRLFDALWPGAPLRNAPAAAAPRLDYTENEAEIRLAVDLPGIEEEDIRVTFEDGVVTIAAERKSEPETPDDGILRHRESFRGHLERKVRLGAEVDADAIRATHKNGVLTVTLPKVAAPAARTIPVSVH